jgi:phospholipase C
LPVQESGTRPARAVPYVLNVNAVAAPASGEVTLEFANTGQNAAVFHVRSSNILMPPRSYTLSPQSRLSDVWGFAAIGLHAYDLSVHGPNGFFRACKGGLDADASANVQSAIVYNVSNGGVTLTAVNKGTAACELSVLDVYTSETVTKTLAVGARFDQFYSLSKHFGWYDFVLKVVEDGAFRQQLAGHLETGKDSTTDPRIATRSAPVGA